MNKRVIIAAVFFMAIAGGLALVYTQKAKQNAETEQAEATPNAAAKPKAEEQPGKDVFLYNAQNRADKYKPTQEKLGFSKKLTSINTEEFMDNKNIRELWIGPQIDHIAERAFKGCSNLKDVHIQGTIAVINDEAFEGCSSIESIVADPWTVGVDCFKNCKNLQSVRFGEHIWWLRVGAFEGCKNLRTVLMGITMEKLDNGAFGGCTSLEEIAIPNNFKNRMFGMISNPSALKRVYMLSTEFYEMPKNCTPVSGCTLYVPDAFLQKFQADAEWSKFGKIVALSESEYYTAEGFWK